MLTMVHTNRARLAQGVLHVDRKFHTGMKEYLRRIETPILSIHPELLPGKDSSVMDLVAIPEKDLGYRVMTVRCSASNQPLREELPRLRATIAASALVYGGGLGIPATTTTHPVPYVAILEYNLRTTVVFAAAGVQGKVRPYTRKLQAIYYYLRNSVPAMRRAILVHCNGYPIYRESAWFNRNRLLYLDSRMHASMIIPEDRLQRRLAVRRTRRPRLIFSGRLEPAKGALDVIKVARACASRNIEFDFDIYGQGSQRRAMESAIEDAKLTGRVRIHEPVPYPTLVEIASECDLFVCCHVQDDPSCTYLESMGCGLPIVGYGNAMWEAMQKDSRAGMVVMVGDHDAAASAIGHLLAEPNELDSLSILARSFAVEHTFEKEFTRRTDSISEILRTRTLT